MMTLYLHGAARNSWQCPACLEVPYLIRMQCARAYPLCMHLALQGEDPVAASTMLLSLVLLSLAHKTKQAAEPLQGLKGLLRNSMMRWEIN